MTPRLLDLFCGAGGAAMGYHRAGFDVVGVDIRPQPRYPFDFIQADALEYVAEHGHEFHAVHASPPCQAYSIAATNRRRPDHPDLVAPTRDLLRKIGRPYVIENVPGAPMPEAFYLCGSTFGLPIVRHRLFEVWPPHVIGLVPSACPGEHATASDHGQGFYPFARKNWAPAWKAHVVPVVWPWLTVDESRQAIPPAYTEYIGRHLLAHVTEGVAS